MTDVTDTANPNVELPLRPQQRPELAAALCATFGVGFELWSADARLDTFPATESHAGGTTTPASGLAVDPAVIRRAFTGDAHPQVLPIDPDHWSLVIPIRDRKGARLIATAVVQAGSSDLLERLARQFQKQNELQRQIAEMDEERNSLIRQVSADLEELTFMRDSSKHLSLLEMSQDITRLAQAIFPKLRQRISAEALVLISAGRDKTACLVGRPVLSVGRNRFDDRTCSHLVERFRDAAIRNPVVENHCRRSEEFAGIQGLRSFILAPMISSNQVLGWVLAINRLHAPTDPPMSRDWPLSRCEFGTNEASLLQSMAAILATHATNIDLLRDKEQLFLDIVRALVNAIDAKDRYTCGHSERVALYAKHLGGAVGLKAKVCQRIYLAGLLHDVGKIAVRDEVLTTTRRLTEKEFAEIKLHPDEGWGILFGLEALDDVLTGVLHHHERWDGQGYPDGLAGEAIPLDARILAVADAFDAMTSDRPYRKALPLEKAVGNLEQGSGTQWDPEIITAFLQVLPEISNVRESFEMRKPPSRRGYRMLHDLTLGQSSASNVTGTHPLAP